MSTFLINPSMKNPGAGCPTYSSGSCCFARLGSTWRWKTQFFRVHQSIKRDATTEVMFNHKNWNRPWMLWNHEGISSILDNSCRIRRRIVETISWCLRDFISIPIEQVNVSSYRAHILCFFLLHDSFNLYTRQRYCIARSAIITIVMTSFMYPFASFRFGKHL